MSKPVVALIGRQNAGKSTLLNRIAGKQLAIVEDFPGTTRDRILADAVWNGVDFTIIDTGGLEFTENNSIARGVRQQAGAAINEADVIIFLTDVKQGLSAVDLEIASLLRKSGKPVILAVNKVDNARLESEVADFYRLGFGDPFSIASHHGRGVADLLDKVVETFPPELPGTEKPVEGLKIAIVGHPNVGKSLLLNRLVGKERSIVSDIAGTTRDAIDIGFDFNGQNMVLIDTAGIRRRGKVEQGIEWYSVLRSMRAIDRADIALLVVDATEALTAQDAHIGGYIEKAAKGVIILVNKWDLVTEKNKTTYTDYIREKLKFIGYAPLLFISAKTGQGVSKIMPLVLQLAQERGIRIPDEEVNSLVMQAVTSHNLPHQGQKILKVYSARQSSINPPTFTIEVNDSRLIHFSYQRFLENRLREVYKFVGTPIRLVFKAKG
ncbi:MAG TPA: ribosome biogenesis GTPase Der [Dehalococcoidales bacterium]|nr:ribosome biogenesis GTPase Der [Dehalococcoidales bacterium]